MSARRFDVLVVGGGPAGSTAATVLARAGASVAILDKASFPRDKACGDLVGPRGVQVLADLGLTPGPGPTAADMLVVGTTGRRVRLPAFAGATYPGHALIVARASLDVHLHQSAVAAGAVAFTGRADEPVFDGDRLDGFLTSAGDELRADFVIGADGATSRVAAVAGLVEEDRVLWGFAVRTYVAQACPMPAIVFWEPTPWRALPGYGWIFPGEAGSANLGLGVGTLSARTGGAAAARLLPDFMAQLRQVGLLDGELGAPQGRVLGGWLKMGMVGTTPAKDNVLLVGDAAGLVNPLQGEGIAQALASGRHAAQAVIDDPAGAARRYTVDLARDHLPYQRVAAALQANLLERPRAVAAVGRVLTSPAVTRTVAGGWGVLWNELLDGAAPGPARRVATAALATGRALTTRTDAATWFRRIYGEGEGRSNAGSRTRLRGRRARRP